MISTRSKTTGTRLATILLGLVFLLFGGYLIYDRVWLSVRSGVIVERIGPILRESEPGWFWYSVGFYAVISLGIALAGLALMRFALRR
ncbi:MAG: hypothetical protein AAF557_18715 [Pseudomonadota bacterium]